jgi:hypothetical protein
MTYCKIFVDTLAGLDYSPAIPRFSDGLRVLVIAQGYFCLRSSSNKP